MIIAAMDIYNDSLAIGMIMMAVLIGAGCICAAITSANKKKP